MKVNFQPLVFIKESVSDAYTSGQLQIIWRKDNPIILNDQLKLPDMEIDDVRAVYCNGVYVYGEIFCDKW